MLVTEALFDQRDFTRMDLLETLFDNLSFQFPSSIPDTTLFMGTSICDLILKFRYLSCKTLFNSFKGEDAGTF